jgi:hypothetical protein
MSTSSASPEAPRRRLRRLHRRRPDLALWEIDHISRHTGISNVPGPGAHKACIAVKLASVEELDAAYADLSAKGVPFQAPPQDYPWNAYCCYFTGPDDEVWELYTWRKGGAPGKSA